MPSSPLKPPARARHIRAFHRRGERAALTPQVIDELFRNAEVIVEGSLTDDPEPRWYGSIMITFRLDSIAGRCRDLDSAAQLDRLVEAITGSVRVRIRAHRMACTEIYERFPDRTVGTAHLDSRFSRDGARLLLDIDLEAPVDLPSSRRRAR
jgi:hypothetical protein